MSDYLNLVDLLNTYNLIGNPQGRFTVPNLGVQQDVNHNYIVSYSFYKTASEIINSGYYNFPGSPSENIVSSANYRNDIESAIQSILNPVSHYSVLFSDVLKLDFQESLTGAGIVTFGQLEGSTALFATQNISAITLQYGLNVTNADKQHGDIWINMDHDLADLPGVGTNYWTAYPSISQGTRAYSVLLEEISHALGTDILDPMSVPRNYDINNHKFTITAHNVHPGMIFEDDIVLPGITAGSDVYGPFPSGLQIFDIAALQEIYGRNYDKRAEETTYSKNGAFQSTLSDGAFVYTIWDGGGNDVIYAYDYNGSVKIDLRQGAFSSIGNDGGGVNGFAFTGNGNNLVITKDIENVAIAYHTVIENATGAESNDVLIGNDWSNILRGHGGNDYLYGDGFVFDGNNGFTATDDSDPNDPNLTRPASDNDFLYGGNGDDYLYGGKGNDALDGGADDDHAYGGDGNDVFKGGDGSDYLYGDADFDTANYSDINAFIKVLSVPGGGNNYTVEKVLRPDERDRRV